LEKLLKSCFGRIGLWNLVTVTGNTVKPPSHKQAVDNGSKTFTASFSEIRFSLYTFIQKAFTDFCLLSTICSAVSSLCKSIRGSWKPPQNYKLNTCILGNIWVYLASDFKFVKFKAWITSFITTPIFSDSCFLALCGRPNKNPSSVSQPWISFMCCELCIISHINCRISKL